MNLIEWAAPRTLRGKLLALVLASAVLPLAATTLMLSWLGQAAGRDHALDLLDARADQLAQDLGEFVDFFGASAKRWATASAGVQVLAELPNPQTSTVGQLQFSMDKVAGADGRIAALALLDPDGRVVRGAPAGGAEIGSRWPQFEVLRQAIADAATGQYAVVPLVEVGRPAKLLFGYPVAGRNGTVSGYVVFAVHIDPFWATVRGGDHRAGAGSYAVVFDEFGVRLADSSRQDAVFRPAVAKAPATRSRLVQTARYGPQTGQWLDSPVAAPEMAAVLPQKDLPRSFVGWAAAQNANALIVPRRLPHVPWMLFYCLPERTIEAQLWAPLARGIAAGLAAIALALALGLWLARRVTEPLGNLQFAVQKLRAGDWSGRAELTGTVEFAELLGEFNAMAEALRSAHDELEGKVAARTTELQRALDQLQMANAELVAQTHELTAQAEELQSQQVELQERGRELQRLNEHKSQFLANMSHELRTPLNAVIGFSDLMIIDDGHLTAADRRQFASDIRKSGEHLLALINDILDLARIEAGHLRLDLDAVYPRHAIDEAIDLVEGAAVAKKVTVQVANVAQLPAVADRLRLRQVLLNLLSNAVKFSPDGSLVQVGAEVADGQMLFWVRDQGPGIDAELQARLFSPFQQGDSPMTKRHGGTGLGLAISRTLVEKMDGSIGVDTARNVGSRFWFRLPLASGPALPQRRVTLSGNFSQTLGGLKVLIVAGDERAAASLADPLTAVGAQVRIATSLVAALETAIGLPPHVCAADEILPDGSGLDLFAALRSDAGNAKVACLLVAAPLDAGQPEPELPSYVAAVARKGTFTADQWVATVESAAGPLARPPASAVPELRIEGPLVLLADDNDLNREVMIRLLRHMGLRIAAARDGEQAVQMAAKETPQLLLLDLAMPKLDGFGTLRALRQMPALAKVPAVAVTALAMRADEEKALAAGFNAYASKPIDVGKFEALVRKLLLSSLPTAES